MQSSWATNYFAITWWHATMVLFLLVF